jgi:hypothetical protein
MKARQPSVSQAEPRRPDTNKAAGTPGRDDIMPSSPLFVLPSLIVLGMEGSRKAAAQDSPLPDSRTGISKLASPAFLLLRLLPGTFSRGFVRRRLQSAKRASRASIYGTTAWLDGRQRAAPPGSTYGRCGRCFAEQYRFTAWVSSWFPSPGGPRLLVNDVSVGIFTAAGRGPGNVHRDLIQAIKPFFASWTSTPRRSE